MNKNFISCFFIFITITFWSSCDEQPPKNALNPAALHPKVQQGMDTANYTQLLWTTTNINFGTHKEGEEVTINFEFENIGNKVLSFEEVLPSCGCTIVDYPKKAIMPNEKGIIKTIYNSKGRGVGMIKKAVTVIGNFNPRPTILHFEGTIN